MATFAIFLDKRVFGNSGRQETPGVASRRLRPWTPPFASATLGAGIGEQAMRSSRPFEAGEVKRPAAYSA
jgi:hypothetical protein